MKLVSVHLSSLINSYLKKPLVVKGVSFQLIITTIWSLLKEFYCLGLVGYVVEYEVFQRVKVSCFLWYWFS